MREAVIKSPVTWEGVDYGECARYIALNWDQNQCRGSKLRRILPYRKKKQGTKPSIKGNDCISY